MNVPRILATTALLLAGLFALPPPAHAAQSYDNCTGFIDSLPATISAQGVWCLRKDLAVAITSGNAITIAANNVTIDCNEFKIGGLSAGNASLANGIYAQSRLNVTIRHCGIRGFYAGVYIYGGAGHLVEDNRFDNNLFFGIYVHGDNSLLQRNRVYDTGGSTGKSYSYGIVAYADVLDNTVSGLFADTSGGYVEGIVTSSTTQRVIRNAVSGLNATATQGGAEVTVGIDNDTNFSATTSIAGNSVVGPASGDIGIHCYTGTNNLLRDNDVSGFVAPISGCTVTDDGGSNSNMTVP